MWYDLDVTSICHPEPMTNCVAIEWIPYTILSQALKEFANNFEV